jgi:hypothetical protein
MSSDIKTAAKDAAHKVSDAAKEMGHAVACGVGQAADYVKDKLGMCDKPLGAANINAVQPHMEVFSSCGCRVGTVDHLEDGTIKLTRKDSPDGRHHFIPSAWVARVDKHVHLNTNADETKHGWKPDAASCRA